MGVVKADSYGHQNIDSVKAVLDGGVNYLCVATLDEALEIRKHISDIPILCLGLVHTEYLNICFNNDITITIPSIEYYNEIKDKNISLKVHIKLNTGMNRLGISSNIDLEFIYNDLKNTKYILEGIYTHIYQIADNTKYNKQISNFKYLTNNIDLNTIKVRHISSSGSLIKFNKEEFINGFRLGIAMYGFSDLIDLDSTFSLYSEIIQIQNIKKGETIGYEGAFTAEADIKIGIVPIGYADGIIRANTGRYIYINNNKYPIVGNICMDMLFVKIDDNIKLYDKVTIIKDNKHIIEISSYLNTIPYEVLTLISKRVPRIYI